MVGRPTTILPLDPALKSDEAYEALISNLRPTGQSTSTSNAANASASASSRSATQAELKDKQTTCSATLELFNVLGSRIDKEKLPALFHAAWEESPEGMLRVLWNSRSICRGRGDQEAFLRGAAWLAEFHPQTLLRDLVWLVRPTDRTPQKRKFDEIHRTEGASESHSFPNYLPTDARSHGYYKDLLNLLVLASSVSPSSSTGTELSVTGDFSRIPGRAVDPDSPHVEARTKTPRQSDLDVGQKAERDARQKQAKKDEKAATRAHLIQLLTTEGSFYRALYLTVARIFGARLKSDWAALPSVKEVEALLETVNELRKAGKIDELNVAREKLNRLLQTRDVSLVSVCAKWAPSEDGFHNRHTLIASAIAEYLTPIEREGDTERTNDGATNSLRVYRHIISTLRCHLEVVETKITSKDYKNIDYKKVPSVAMTANKKLFNKHDPSRFKDHLETSARIYARVSGAILNPGYIFKLALSSSENDEKLAEAQWQTLERSLQDSGKLSNCLAVADCTSSMQSPLLADKTCPLHSSIAFSLLIARTTCPPFRDSAVSFSDTPRFIDLDPSLTLRQAYEKFIKEGMGYSADFIAVFREILKKAVSSNVTPENMIKRLYVFTDLEFSQTQSSYRDIPSYTTHLELVKSEYDAAGYQLPQLVFWNLSPYGPTSTSASIQQIPRTAMLGGYSTGMVKTFLEGGVFESEEETVIIMEDGTTTREAKKQMTAKETMLKMIYHESYSALKVYD